MQSFDERHLVSLAPWGRMVAVLAVVAAVAILGLAWRALKNEPRAARRWSLLALRAGAVAAALVLFFQPALRVENLTRVPNHLAVLVDDSESMRLAERAGQPSRAARAAAFVAAQKGALSALRGSRVVDFYTFAERLAPSTEEALAQPPPATRRPGDATQLREALAALRTRYDGHDLAGVVVISDGIDNGRLGTAPGAPLDADTRDFLKTLDAPVHTVWTGHPGLHDIAVADVLADDFAFVRTAVQIEAVLRVVGAGAAGWEGRTLPVTLRRDGVPVRTVEITVEPGRTDYRVAFPFTPERVGKYLYEISTPLVEGEAIAENNARAFVLKVIRDKIRVLLVSGRPSWDERFLRGLLKHDPNVDLISFFILRTPADLESAPSDELSLIPFPTEELFEEQLRSFDLVFLQNFNYGPYGIGAYLQQIKRYVEEGGGLAMIGGDLAFSLGGYAHTPVADVLPVELPEGEPDVLGGTARAGLERLADGAAFRMRLSAEGRAHPVTALKVDLAENDARWAALPELEGCNVVARAKPGATVLGVHPVRRDADGRPLPILTVGEAGQGRVLALAADSSWRWGFADRSGDATRGRAYQRFWDGAIRWLIRDPTLSFLRIETDRSEYTRGQRVGIDVTALGSDYQPLKDVALTVTIAQAMGGRAVPYDARSGRSDDAGTLHLDLDPPPPGGYRITARGTLGGRPTVEEEVFLVRGAGRELEAPEARDDLLRAVAAASGGSFRGLDGSLAEVALQPPRVVRVNHHHDVELWSGWWVLAAAALCLSANWALRRRWGYT